MPTLQFHIGGAARDYTRVEIKRSNGDGWLSCLVSVRVGGFAGEFDCHLDCWAFQRLANELRQLNLELKGTATFSTYEQQLALAFIGDGLGHVKLKGNAMDIAGTGNSLSFQLDLDQTSLPKLIEELDAIVAAYPPPAVA